MKALFSFKAKVIKPCGKLLSSFKHKFRRRSRPRGIRTRVVRFRKPFSLKSLSFPQCRPKTSLRKRRPAISTKTQKSRHFRPRRQTKPAGKPVPKVRIAELLTVLFSLRKLPKEVDTDTSEQVNMTDVTSIVSVSERGHGKEPFPSPTTPAYVRPSTESRKDSSEDLEDVEDSCGSFESYLIEMILEDGKMKDLLDVEELLYCWKNLKSPIFVDLVSGFYGEICKDLLSQSEEEGESQVTSISE